MLDAQIIVIDGIMANMIAYPGHTERKKKYFLYKTGSHVHPIVNIAAFWNKGYYCTTCNVPYKDKRKHSCATSCAVCLSDNCLLGENPILCQDCGFTTRSQECYERHKTRGTYSRGVKKGEEKDSPCETHWKCLFCHRSFERAKRPPEIHNCDEYHCISCDEYVPRGHLCYLRAENPKSTSGKFLTFDFECTQDTVSECKDGYHPPPQKPDCFKCKQIGDKCADCRRCVNCKKKGFVAQ